MPYQQIDEDVLKGWKKKIEFSSTDLSNLNPFIELILLYSEKETNGLKVSNSLSTKKMFENSGIFYIKRDEKSREEQFTGFPLFKTQSQMQNTSNVYRKESGASSRYKGGGGITSLEVKKGGAENFTNYYDLSLYVSEPEMLNELREYLNLIRLGSRFLLNYGWTSSGNLDFDNPPAIKSENSYRLYDYHKGYWSSSLVELYKFNYNFDSLGNLEGSISFLSPGYTYSQFMRVSSIKQKVRNFLSGSVDDKRKLENTTTGREGGQTLAGNKFSIERGGYIEVTENIRSKVKGRLENPSINLPNKIGIYSDTTIKTKNSEGKDEVKKEKNLRYYYLGHVIEAIITALEEVSDDQNKEKIKKIEYSNIPDNAIDVINDFFQDEIVKGLSGEFEDSTREIISEPSTKYSSKKISNVYSLPIHRELLDDIILNENMPINELIKSCLEQVKESTNGVILSTRVINDKLNIFLSSVSYKQDITVYTQDLNREDQQKNQFHINYGSSQSLVENLSISSRLDPGAYEAFQLPFSYIFSDEEKLSEVFSKDRRLRDEYENFYQDEVLSKTTTGQRNISYSSNNVANFLRGSADRYLRFIESSGKDRNVFGDILSLFLRRADVTIHGTIGVSPFNVISLKGLMDSMEGLYNILSVTDKLTPNSFSTSLDLSLIHPSGRQ